MRPTGVMRGSRRSCWIHRSVERVLAVISATSLLGELEANHHPLQYSSLVLGSGNLGEGTVRVISQGNQIVRARGALVLIGGSDAPCHAAGDRYPLDDELLASQPLEALED